jgi:hypothetical protein
MDLFYYLLFAYVCANIWQNTMCFRYSLGWGFACVFIPLSDLFFAMEVREGWRPIFLKCIIVLLFIGNYQLKNTYNAYLAYSTQGEAIIDGNSISSLKKIYYPEIKNAIGLMSNSCYGKNESEESKIENNDTKKTPIINFYFPIILKDNPLYVEINDRLNSEEKNKPFKLQNIDIIVKTAKYKTLEDTPIGIKEFESIQGKNYEFNLDEKKSETDFLKDCFKIINNDNYILIDIDKPSFAEDILYSIGNIILIALCILGLYRNITKPYIEPKVLR